MIVKMIQNLENKMELQINSLQKMIEKMEKWFNKDLEEKKKKESISSVQFSHSVMSDSLRSRESQHTRPPSPSPTPGVHSDSRPSSQ